MGETADAGAGGWLEAAAPDEADRIDAAALGVPGWFAPLLARRGVASTEEAIRFLRPTLEHLHDPALLLGLDRALDRLIAARDSGEVTVIVGDYDVDGVSSTALLLAVFRACGIKAEPILPHRVRDGYGFQSAQVEKAREIEAGLIVTVDCGSRSTAEARQALELGIDVIVVDHHIPGEPHDPAVVHINPHQPDATYPFKPLAAAGLAFKLATALAERAGREIAPELLLRVSCLGTIADMVPLEGENRVIAKLGLDALADTRSPGLRALMDVSGVKPPLSGSDVGFRLGPRINAAGRMDSADAALELLMARDLSRAQDLAAELDRLNSERRQAEVRVVDEATKLIEELPELPPILVVAKADWHRGVVGIAAGRLARRFHRPALLLAIEDGLATGSGRSVKGIHLHAFLDQWAERLERFGGHSQAVGLTLRVDELEALKNEWETEAAASWDPALLLPTYRYDAWLPCADITVELTRTLARLEPFGVGNREPLVRVGPLEPVVPPRFFGENHVSQRARGEDGGTLDIVAWRWRDRADVFKEPFEALGNIELDGYTGRPALRLLTARNVDPAGR